MANTSHKVNYLTTGRLTGRNTGLMLLTEGTRGYRGVLGRIGTVNISTCTVNYRLDSLSTIRTVYYRVSEHNARVSVVLGGTNIRVTCHDS